MIYVGTEDCAADGKKDGNELHRMVPLLLIRVSFSWFASRRHALLRRLMVMASSPCSRCAYMMVKYGLYMPFRSKCRTMWKFGFAVILPCSILRFHRSGMGSGPVVPMSGVPVLKPSEYRGDKDTAVAGRIVTLTMQEFKGDSKAATQPRGKKGKTAGKGGQSDDSGVKKKVEAHLAATSSPTEVLYIEAWGEIGTKLMQLCAVGDLVSIQGGTVQEQPASYSTSRLHYHLRLKGHLGLNVKAVKLSADPWEDVPAVHPLVPLEALDRVKDKQQICVSVVVVDQPGAIERQTSSKMSMVCNALVQQGQTKVRCSFWGEHASELANQPSGQALLLYQVLVTKRKDVASWELTSWRGTSIQACPPDIASDLMLGGKLMWTTLVFRCYSNCFSIRLRFFSCFLFFAFSSCV